MSLNDFLDGAFIVVFVVIALALGYCAFYYGSRRP